MKGNKAKRLVAVTLSSAMCAGAVCSLVACGGGKRTAKDGILTIMTEDLNGVFNPFYSTAGTDMEITGMTQLSMLTTDSKGNIAYGDDEAVVVKDYKSERVDGNTVHTFVLKNGITFSDGVPLTMNDVLFNMYVYLDPVYTGSSTMYSTKILGLQQYRTQIQGGEDSSAEEQINTTANNYARNRKNELVNIFYATGKTSAGSSSYEATPEQMYAAFEKRNPSNGYLQAIGEKDVVKARAQLKEDYDNLLEKFKEELSSDYDRAKSAYDTTTMPYSEHKELFEDNIFAFMFSEGLVDVEYGRDSNNKLDRSKIVKLTKRYPSEIKTKSDAVEYLYDMNVSTKFDQIFDYWSSGSEVFTEFVSKARDVVLHENLKDGEKAVPSISGIKSLGHEQTAPTSVTIGDKTYNVARTHKETGVPANENEYDVLQVTVKGVDPKAVWNFGFSVAPYHYYSDPSQDALKVDIAANKFGVEWGSFDFMENVIKGEYKTSNGKTVKKVKVPLGAGPYVASNNTFSTEIPADGEFYNTTENKVSYRSNESFVLHAPNIKKLQYIVVSSTNALNRLQTDVNFVTPQFTKANADLLQNSLKKDGYNNVSTWQLGYGYIGINAGKVPNRNLRKAIMAAMDVSLALSYYSAGTARNISWPMSLVSWAYPKQEGYTDALEGADNKTGKDYIAYDGTTPFDNAKAKKTVQKYMSAAGVQPGDPQLKIKFTIAGANLTEHPTYLVFKDAAELLNECGWQIEVDPDPNALVKLATGSLAVWAAAWGSTIDPDMYQVYHKDSTATSTYSWGYREIIAGNTEEMSILTKLSRVIDQARETDDQNARTAMYRTAMGYVQDLAVELPVYQRQVLYAYDAQIIDEKTLPAEINPYTSPLSKIWDVDFVKAD